MATSSCLILRSCLAWFAILTTLGSTAGQSGRIRSVIQSTLAQANNDFAFDLYRQIVESSSAGSNVVFSPTSISLTLALVYAGAAGATKSQLATAMHLNNYSPTDEPINEGFKSIIESLSRLANAYTLQMANQLYVQSGQDLSADYLQTTNDYYHTAPEQLDFNADPSAAIGTINNWVAKVTSNKFTELFPENSITSSTSVVLVSAAVLRSSWMFKFDRRATKPQAFHLSETKDVKVQMMNLPRVYGLRYTNSTDYDCQVLELPYTGDEISMFLFLPNEIEGLASLEARLGSKSLAEIFRAVDDLPDAIQVSMPKFVLQKGIDLKQMLTAVGVEDLFNADTADLSGMRDTDDPLVLSNAVHRANLVVSEEGTAGEDAAMGVVVFPVTTLPTMSITVDRPFLILLMEKTTGSILFVGRVTNPLQSN